MSNTYTRYPSTSSSGVPTYANFASLPASSTDGSLAVTLDTDSLYAFNAATATWVLIGTGSNTVTQAGALDGASSNAKGITVGSNTVYLQSAGATFPGVVTSASQTFAGVKIFNSAPRITGFVAAPLRTDGSGNLTSGSTNLTNEVVGILPAANTSPLSSLSGSVSLTAQVSGILPLLNGGTSLSTMLPFSVHSNNTSTPNTLASNQSIVLGAQTFVDPAIAVQATSSASLYFQHIIQNVSTGSQSSTDYIVNNNLGTSSSNYTDLGMNSSTFTGNGSLAIAGAGYLYTQGGDLVIATQSNNTLRFLTNNSSQDALQINTSNFMVVPQFSGSGVVVSSGAAGLLGKVTIIPPAMGGSTGSNTGDISLAAVGASPNANAATISAGQVLNLQPYSNTLPGVTTTAAQSAAGAKAFTTSVQSPSVIVGSITFTQSAAGATYSLTYPANQGALNQALTNSSGTGVLAWSSVLTNPMTALGDLIVGSSSGTPVRMIGSIGSTSYLSQTGSGGSSNFPTWTPFRPPLLTKYTNVGSATHTMAATTLYAKVRVVGGGGGGAGGGTAAGSGGGEGGASLFGTSLISANGGGGGAFLASVGSSGGSASLGIGPVGIAVTGGKGSAGGGGSVNTSAAGVAGGVNPMGGNGGGGATSGGPGAANTGAGGGGGGNGGAINSVAGASGAAGGFVEAYLYAPTVSSAGGVFAVSVGGGGTAGGAGTSGGAGAAGGTGLVEVIEFSQ